MKILLYGEYWEGTHVDSIAKVMEGLHIEYAVFDFFKFFRNSGAARNTLENYYLRILNRLLYIQIEARINKELLNFIDFYQPTSFVISKGINIYPETLKAISQKSILIINWNPDDYFNKKNSSKHLINSLPIYDIVISSRLNRYQHYLNSGVKRIEYIDWYYIPWLHKLNLSDPLIENKILYVGAYSKKRDWFLSNISDKYLLEIYGGGWAKSRLVKSRKNTLLTKQIMPQKDFPIQFRKAKVNLNILNDLNFDETNLKLFEISACAGFMLSSFSHAAEKILAPNKDCMYFEIWDVNDVNQKIEEIFRLADSEYENIRNSGYHSIVEGHHSINDRVQTLLTYCI